MKAMTRLFVMVLLAGMVSFGCGGSGGGSDPVPGPGPEETYDLTGTITISGGAALPGVTMTLSGAGSGTAMTDASGNYSFTGLANGSYTVTPSLAGYTFDPTNQAVTISGANVPLISFTATVNPNPTYSISGTITKSGGGALSGVTMTLSGAGSGTAKTNGSGNYTFSGLGSGSYTVTPSPDGYTFNPISKQVTISGANVTSISFTAIDDHISALLKHMVSIPAGSFMMGSADDQYEQARFMTPVHQVILPGFDIGAYEVTQAQYFAVMGTNPSAFNGPGNENNPVEQVSWYEARAFCTALSAMTGRTFTLPSEAQWEYACRAGTTTLYSYGSSDALLGNYAWWNSNSESQTHPVGTKLPNPWGLYDMHGNVWEWCLDSWHTNYDKAPKDGSAWEPNTGDYRILRGGSWTNLSPWEFQSMARTQYNFPDYKNSAFGFRVIALPKVIDDLLNSMVSIPAGTFTMGSMVWSDEMPPHDVTLQAFDIGAYEVTQAQYQAIMGVNPSYCKAPTYPGSDNRPVEQINWYEAREFCTKLSDLTGRTFTLPSEAQWEYACRAGSTTLYSYGDSDTMLGDYAWWYPNSYGTGRPYGTHPVGTKLSNNWGLYDMMGNVWEWCLDSWHTNYDGAPKDGSAWEPETGDNRMFRGGSLITEYPVNIRSASRFYDMTDSRCFCLGFRVIAVRAPR